MKSDRKIIEKVQFRDSRFYIGIQKSLTWKTAMKNVDKQITFERLINGKSCITLIAKERKSNGEKVEDNNCGTVG